MYEWIKAFHVIFVISWMAGMLYLPRLYVYHVDAPAGSDRSEAFKVMERRLLRGIMTPAMILTWLSGLYIAYSGGWFTSGWLHGKLALVVIMSGIHGFLAGEWRKLNADKRPRSARFYRILNEIPALLMVGIVILVIVKPL
jgi:protoporphyrinogen IX oxidase